MVKRRGWRILMKKECWEGSPPMFVYSRSEKNLYQSANKKPIEFKTESEAIRCVIQYLNWYLDEDFISLNSSYQRSYLNQFLIESPSGNREHPDPSKVIKIAKL